MDSPQQLPPNPQQATLRMLDSAETQPRRVATTTILTKREDLMILPVIKQQSNIYLCTIDLTYRPPIIYMFHCFHRQTIKVPKRTPNKLLAILPLHSNHIAVLDDSQTITLYKLPSGKAVSHLQLPFKPRRWAVASPDSIILLAAEERSVYQVLPWEESYRLVTHFQPSHHYNTQQVILREKEYFSTMALTSFNDNIACFLREQRMEERKLRLHFIQKKEGEWANSFHELGLNGALVEKADQRSRVAVWKQQVATAGQMDFSVIQLQTMQQQEVHLQSVLFTLFTIVKSIRATSQGWLLCLNHKQPQLLFFSSKTNHHQVRDQHIHTNLLWIAVSDHSLLTFTLSEQDNHSGRIELRRQNGEVMDGAESISEEVVVSRDGEMVVEYDRERKESPWVALQVTRLIRKEKLYLNLLEAWGQQLKGTISNAFMREVLELL